MYLNGGNIWFSSPYEKERGLGPPGQRDVDFDNGCNDSFISFMLFFNVLGNLMKCHGR